MTTPFSQFSQWLDAAKAHKDIAEPTAMALATVSNDGQPSVRMVLLKSHDEHGFVFYTNLQSHKGRDLAANPKAALCFYWMPMMRQVRIEGAVEAVNDADADAYFASRPRDSQLGAWASVQSQPLPYTGALMASVAEYGAKFLGRAVPRPPHWSGFRLVPQSIEFWQQGNFRLHDRMLYVRENQGWKILNLYP